MGWGWPVARPVCGAPGVSEGPPSESPGSNGLTTSMPRVPPLPEGPLGPGSPQQAPYLCSSDPWPSISGASLLGLLAKSSSSSVLTRLVLPSTTCWKHVEKCHILGVAPPPALVLALRCGKSTCAPGAEGPGDPLGGSGLSPRCIREPRGTGLGGMCSTHQAPSSQWAPMAPRQAGHPGTVCPADSFAQDMNEVIPPRATWQGRQSKAGRPLTLASLGLQGPPWSRELRV